MPSRRRHWDRDRRWDRWEHLSRTPRPAAKPKPPRPAAGILFRHTDLDGTAWWMLGQRCERLGGTWSNLGGSIEHDETPLIGALREVWEEAAISAASLEGATLVTQVESGTEAIPYTLFVIEVPDFIEDAVLGWENDDLAWFPTEDVALLELHDGFARGWAQL